MRKGLSLLVFICLSFSQINGQKTNLYIPINIQKAINSGTRTLSGQPGDNYWQNKSDYNISATVDPETSLLVGEATINYYNNSPDSLKRLVIHLYQDITKPAAVRDWYVGEENLAEEVKLNYLIMEGDTIDVSPTSREIVRLSTNLIVRLKEKLIPQSSLKLQIGWEYKIPEKLKIRTGNYDNGNMYVAYWYPQIAVYDDIDGWDMVDYSGLVEFYNDFSNYDIKIKVPKGLVVWCTGNLVNGNEVLRSDIFEKYEKAKSSDETINIITKDDLEKGIVTADNEINTWHFVAESVPAVAFATSKSFLWDGASLIVDQKSGRRTLTDVVYSEGDAHYDKGVEYSKVTVEYLSNQLPGYPYLYPHATAYSNGSRGGGMESPMMANNGAPSNLGEHVGLLFHEISHNYFPFIMGTNERKYAWMDEGWASFLPTEIIDQLDPEYDYRARNVKGYAKSAGTETDLPLAVPSYSYKTRDSRLGFYSRPANAYYELKELLGDVLFKECLLEYINRWNGKHPIPQDFFHTFNEISNQDLSWFWKPWFYEFGYPDLAVADIVQEKDEIAITINKLGNIPTRVFITIEFTDGEKEMIEKPSSVWKNGKEELIILHKSSKAVKSVLVGHKYIPDSIEENNLLVINN